MNDSTKGLIYLVGLGPGSYGNLTPSARDALRDSDAIIGFHSYVDQITELVQGKEIISMALGQEMERAEKAVDLANTGKTVSVVSSGDAGIYGMSGPVFKALCDRNWDGSSPRLETIPGISALQSSDFRDHIISSSLVFQKHHSNSKPTLVPAASALDVRGLLHHLSLHRRPDTR